MGIGTVLNVIPERLGAIEFSHYQSFNHFVHPCNNKKHVLVQLQGGLVLAALGVGWLLAGLVRSKEVQRRRLQLPREDTGDEVKPSRLLCCLLAFLSLSV